MESLKIIGFCILAAIVYGVVHDQFTARICIEYFTVFHPPVFPTQSPTLLGVGWGVIATWWVGAILGTLLCAAARLGSRRKAAAHDLMRPILLLLGVMAINATLFGFLGYFFGGMPTTWAVLIPPASHQRFVADWWAHSASYATGFFGGLVVCIFVYSRRGRASSKTALPTSAGA